MERHDYRQHNLRLGSLKVDTPNIGDHIQILAALGLLREMGLEPDLFIDRDTELANKPELDGDQARIVVPLNGWFKMPGTDGPQWPPHEHILPIFSGFHIRPHVCPALLEEASLNYLKRFEPIGCRDLYTAETLRRFGVSAYFTNCLSLTFPERPIDFEGDVTFVCSNDRSLLDVLPADLRRDYVFIDHYCHHPSFEAYLDHARSLLSLYRNRARLVVTTFLHCALPCLAMGIPVIVFYPNRADAFMRNSDRERFSGLATLTRIHEFADAVSMDWRAERLNVFAQKEFARSDFIAQVRKALTT